MGDTMLKSPLPGAGPPLPRASGEQSGHRGPSGTPVLGIGPSLLWSAWLMSY